MTALLLAVPLALAAPVPKDLKKPATDLAALQGEWECVEKNTRGNQQKQSGIRYVVEGNQLRILGGVKGDATPRVVTLTLDEKTKTYTWDASWGNWIGRYKIDGDTFSRASVKKGQPLPDEVAPGPNVEYSVFTRVKK